MYDAAGARLRPFFMYRWCSEKGWYQSGRVYSIMLYIVVYPPMVWRVFGDTHCAGVGIQDVAHVYFAKSQGQPQ